MANYTFLDAYGSVQTAASSVISGIQYPVVKLLEPVSIAGTFTQSGTFIVSISGILGGGGTVPIKDDTQFGDGVTSGILSEGVRLFNATSSAYDRLRGASVAGAILGVMGEDTPHISGDPGLFTLGVRNDTLASITSASGDYSPYAVGPVGEVVVANAPITKWVQGNASILSAPGSVAVIAAQGSSIFTYITGVQVTTYPVSSILLALYGGTSSLVGYAASNVPMTFPNALKTNANAAFSASIIVGPVASIYLSAQGFISKT